MQIPRFLLAIAVVVAATPTIIPARALAQTAARSPGLSHTFFMRGSVVKNDAGNLVLCVGKADGAKAGQILRVYRNKEHPHGPRGAPIFQRVEMGTVRIDAIIDNHFARATKVSGAVMLNDIVELKRTRG